MKNLADFLVESLNSIVKRKFRPDISDNDFKKFITQDIEKCFKQDITSIRINLNPTAMGSGNVIKNDTTVRLGEMSWNDKTPDTLLEIFRSFGFYGKDGEEFDLSKDVIGWNIVQNGQQAQLTLQLNSEGQKLFKEHIGSMDRLMGS